MAGYNGLPDAMAGGYAGALEEAALIYTDADQIRPAIKKYIDAVISGETRSTIVGGTDRVSKGLEDYMVDRLNVGE